MVVNYIILALVAMLVGFVVFWTLIFALKRKLQRDNLLQKKQILKESARQVERIRADVQSRIQTKLLVAKEELENNIATRLEDLKVSEEELKSQEESAQAAESQLKRHEREYEQAVAKASAVKEVVEGQKSNLLTIEGELRSKLEQVSGVSAARIAEDLRNQVIEQRQLEAQRILKTLTEDLNASTKRMGNRMLSRILSRYAPEFVWPKPVNNVELLDNKLVDLVQSDQHPLLQNLRELSGATIEMLRDNQDQVMPVIKLVGGYGIYREAARLSIEELKTKHPNSWGKVADVYIRHREALEHQALVLGKRAVKELRIKNMHVEILKMVGSLNWRTSYRQNQYLHSVEVSRLAGMIANELGVDPDLAKRSGLLHDIGKSIDYRIEGSHAVISGDYADRFGESRLMCDTVMSHHNDLRLETALSYVLKAADTLSGARPGARVNLEEGYQIRLSAIEEVVRSFPGVVKHGIMNGGREVHVEVNHKRISESDLASLSAAIAKRIEEQVQYPGQIKVMVTRRFESVAVA